MNENRYSVREKFNVIYPEQKKYVLESMKHQLGVGLLEKIFEPGREIICISPISQEEFPRFDNEPTVDVEFQVSIEYAHRYPVLVPGGFVYKDKFVRPINDLSFFERIKFLFTGEYPI